MIKTLIMVALLIVFATSTVSTAKADGGATNCCCVSGCTGSGCQSICKP
jgi:hypothetical protein